MLHRYIPKYMHYEGGVYETRMPEWTRELTEAQRAVLEPPYIYNRPLIEDDGESIARAPQGGHLTRPICERRRLAEGDHRVAWRPGGLEDRKSRRRSPESTDARP